MKRERKAEENDSFLERYEKQLWSCQNCFCGLCIEVCPAYQQLKNEAVTARGLAQICLGFLNGELQMGQVLDDIVYSCMGCGFCETVCSMNTPLYIQRCGTRETKVSGSTMAEILRSLKISEGGKMPPEIRNALVSLKRHGNPYGVGDSAKDDWINGLGVGMGDSDRIVYVGATVPYDSRSTIMAKALIDVLRTFEVDFGVLGSQERDSGALARMMGEEWLLAEMVEHNTRVFNENKIREIICLSPHDYHAFTHYYTGLKDVKIWHYSQALWQMIEEGTIVFHTKLDKRATYHDSCFLGRRNGIYSEPRRVIQSIPGLEYVEMKESAESALCCGGGGVGLVFEVRNCRTDLVRVDQAKSCNAEILAVACPICYQMLDSAVKSKGYNLRVMDISELVLQAI